jgi:hypothetical protein
MVEPDGRGFSSRLTTRSRNIFEFGMLNFQFLQLSSFRLSPVVPVAASVKTKLGRRGISENPTLYENVKCSGDLDMA